MKTLSILLGQLAKTHRFLSSEASLTAFRLPKGYRPEVVACDPMISEPLALAWDGNGRLFVARIETYMQTVPTTDQSRPLSHIMLLKNTDGEGKGIKAPFLLISC